jgi:hypothetical protein
MYTIQTSLSDAVEILMYELDDYDVSMSVLAELLKIDVQELRVKMLDEQENLKEF